MKKLNFHRCYISFVTILITVLNSVDGTIIVVSGVTNDTVLEVEEAGINSASAYGLTGQLVISNPLDACGTVSPPPANSSIAGFGTRNWILIATVSLYENEDACSLARKTKNAQFAGYSGIIFKHIGSNDTDGVIPRFIGFDWMGVKIYSCVVGEDIGSFLMEKYSYPSRYYVAFENEPYYPVRLFANFIIIGFLGIVIVLLLIRLFHYLYFRVTLRVVERRRIRKTLLSESQLRKLPVLQWNNSIPQDTCSICIEQFEDGEEIRVLPCSHVFHKMCIDRWLLKESRKCPNCKGRVLFPNEHYSYSSDSEDSNSGDERTPLLGRRRGGGHEDYRFVETLTESHNTRAIAHTHSHYLVEPQPSPVLKKNTNPSISGGGNLVKTTPKVTFAPTTSSRSSAVTSTSSHSHAFVLPMSAKPSFKSPLRKSKPPTTENPSTSTSTNAIVNDVEHELSCSPSTSEETLIEFRDIPIPDEFEGNNSLTESIDSRSLSFHSCQGFESDESQHQFFQSFSSQNNP